MVQRYELVKIGYELVKMGYELVGNELEKVRVDLYPIWLWSEVVWSELIMVRVCYGPTSRNLRVKDNKEKKIHNIAISTKKSPATDFETSKTKEEEK